MGLEAWLLLLRALLLPVADSAPTPPASYPLPIPCTGEGCTGFTSSLQDYNVIEHQNGTYYRVSMSNGTGHGLELSSAPGLAGPWVRQQPILGPDVHLVGQADAQRPQTYLWAPDLHFSNNLYYLYYSIFNQAIHPGFDIRVATSPDMADNSWTDHGSIGVPAAPTRTYASIDPSILRTYCDPYGIAPARHIAWGSFGGALYGMNLDPTNNLRVSSTGAPVPLIQDQPTPVEDASVHGNNRTEGAFHIRMNGWVYFFYSRGSCCGADPEYAYVTEVCRAASATGPFVDRNGKKCAGNSDGSTNGSGTLLMQSHGKDSTGNYTVMAPGSVGIVKLDEGPVITYQYINQTAPRPVPINLYFGYNYLNFDADGWPFLADTPQRISY